MCVQGIRGGCEIPPASQCVVVVLALLFLLFVLWSGQAGTEPARSDSTGLETSLQTR